MSTRESASRETRTGNWTPDDTEAIMPSPSHSSNHSTTHRDDNTARSLSRVRMSERCISPPTKPLPTPSPVGQTAQTAPEPITGHPCNRVSLDRLLYRIGKDHLNVEQAAVLMPDGGDEPILMQPVPPTALECTVQALDDALLERQEAAFEAAEWRACQPETNQPRAMSAMERWRDCGWARPHERIQVSGQPDADGNTRGRKL